MRRPFTLLDRVLIELDHALKTTLAASTLPAERLSPANSEPEAPLSEDERKLSERLMRVNHSGEIAAQALYRGQALFAQNQQQREALLKAANEEQDHLIWCKKRLHELSGHSSYLAPFWYSGSFCIGVSAGFAGDRWSLGFIEETENQVSAHLENHLGKLPKADHRSRAILAQMHADESEHAEAARAAGAKDLPLIIKKLMSKTADVMKFLSYRL